MKIIINDYKIIIDGEGSTVLFSGDEQPGINNIQILQEPDKEPRCIEIINFYGQKGEIKDKLLDLQYKY